jgi:hypothetical protein
MVHSLLEGTFSNTATTTTSLDNIGSSSTLRNTFIRRIWSTIATHARCIAIKQGRVNRVLSVAVVVHILLDSQQLTLRIGGIYVQVGSRYIHTHCEEHSHM